MRVRDVVLISLKGFLHMKFVSPLGQVGRKQVIVSPDFLFLFCLSRFFSSDTAMAMPVKQPWAAGWPTAHQPPWGESSLGSGAEISYILVLFDKSKVEL